MPLSEDVRRELADQRLAVYADPKMLQQILANLLSNAIKYSADGGTITLDANGDWTRNTGETDIQAALVERQRRHRASP